MAHEASRFVVQAFGEAQHLLRDGKRGAVFGLHEAGGYLAKKRAEELLGLADLFAQLARPREGSVRLRNRVAFRGDQRAAQRDLQFDLLPVPLRVRKRAGERVEPLLQLCHGLCGRPAPRRLARGSQPKTRRLAGHARFRVVMRQHRRMRLHRVGKALLQCFRDAAVQPLPLAAQQGAIGDILHQRVLERVERLWRRAPLEEQLRCDELLERTLERRPVQRRDGVEQLVGECPPDSGTDLRRLFSGRPQSIEARHQGGLQGGRNRERRRRCRRHRVAGVGRAGAGFEHRLR